MALHALPSPSSGDSHSPSPDLPSVDASPVSSTTSLYVQPSDEADPSLQRTSTGTPTRAMSDLTRSSSSGKGGCWTCRVRRKKCDEEREGDSCKTCLRLRIKCLGWGPKRPDWMRDKEKVAQYKASIKDQLSRMGLIRGQPRQPWHATGLASSQPPTPGVAGPGPQTTLRRSMSARETYSAHRRDSGYMSAAPYHVPNMTNSMSDADWVPHNLPSSSRHHSRSQHSHHGQIHHHQGVSPMIPNPLLSTPSNEAMHGYGFPSPPLSISGHDDLPYSNYHPAGQGMAGMSISAPAPPAPTPAPPMPSGITQDEYIAYFFRSVRDLTYVVAGEGINNVLLPFVQSEPDGAVALSLCALAALHHARARMAQSPQPIFEDPDAETSVPRQFYNRALMRLLHGPQTNGLGQYSDADAVTAVQLIAYSLLAGGSTDWQTPLDCACEWLSQTGIYNEENPRAALLKMSAPARFAAKATIYVDIFASITLMQPPRYLSLYKRLFGPGFYGGRNNMATANSNNAESELRMTSFSGCPDEALLAIAEISALASWKAQEQRNGSLSVRELIRRGDIIEKELRERASAYAGSVKREADFDGQPGGGLSSSSSSLDVGGATPAGLPMASSMQMSALPGMSGARVRSGSPEDSERQIIGEMFREAAVLYLHTVLSESSPGVPEIIHSVDQMLKLLNQLTPSPLDRSLVFPLFLTGCMTDNQMMREVIKHRFFMQDATVGYILLAQTVMDEVWTTRAQAVSMTRPGDRPVIADWRQSLTMPWARLILV